MCVSTNSLVVKECGVYIYIYIYIQLPVFIYIYIYTSVKELVLENFSAQRDRINYIIAISEFSQ